MLKKNSIIYRNLYLLIIRLIAVLFIYQLCRIFYLFYNIDYFININYFEYFKIITGSLKFDVSAILYSNLLVIFLSLFPSKLFTLYIK